MSGLIRPKEKATSHAGEENLLPAPTHISGFANLRFPVGPSSWTTEAEAAAGGKVKTQEAGPLAEHRHKSQLVRIPS